MRTALYQHHMKLGAKIVPFSGWEMPLYYQSIIHEHHIVRNHVGLFDVSHMGRLIIKGKEAEALIDYLSANCMANRPDGSVTYTVWCHYDGGTVDDMLVYRKNCEEFYVVVNAGNRQKDLNHALEIANRHSFNIEITTAYDTESILAIQGPQAEPLIKELFPKSSELSSMHFALFDEEQESDARPMIISKTGYTGAGGYEIYLPSEKVVSLWERLLATGSKYAIEPVGLGARDTLRLDMGYALYGHEITDQIAPTESVARWSVKCDKSDFIGKKALQQLETNPGKRIAYGVLLLEEGIAREGYAVWHGGRMIGLVTSGTFSPSLNKAIALILVEEGVVTLGDTVDIQIRKKLVKGQIVPLPFLH